MSHRAPSGLGAAGRALWTRLAGPDGFDPDPHEIGVLEAACRQQDDIHALEAALKQQGLMVTGSTGQMRLSPIVSELRQSRLALVKMLDVLAVPVEDAKLPSPASVRASKAARARWDRQRKYEDRRLRVAGGDDA